jgi:hypothetical protein
VAQIGRHGSDRGGCGDRTVGHSTVVETEGLLGHETLNVGVE